MKWMLGRGGHRGPLFDAPGAARARESRESAQADGELRMKGQRAWTGVIVRGPRAGGEAKVRRGQGRREEWFRNERGTVG